MHLETLLYMLLQSSKTRPPPGVTPDFEALAKQAREVAVPNQWIKVPASTISIGLDDPENDDGPERYFGWDNEKPPRILNVPAFKAQARPLTNEDYARFLEQTGRHELPASWTTVERPQGFKANGAPHVNGDGVYLNKDSSDLIDAYRNDKFVRTVYGPVPLKYALDWPVFASYDELSRCASWMGGRIPTANEARSIYNYVDINKNKHADSILTKKVSAVNGQVVFSYIRLTFFAYIR